MIVFVKDSNKESGFIIATLLASMTFLFLISVIIFRLVVSNYRIAEAQTARINAQLAADAGADIAISELNLDENWPGTSATVWSGVAEEITFYTDVASDFNSTYEATIVNGTELDEKTISIIGRVYSPIGSTDPVAERSYEVDMRGLGISSGGSGTFSIVTGVGGLSMSNSAKIVDGDVYVNGTVSVTNTAQIGTTSTPVSVKAAHTSCPTSGGSTYPTLCASGQPITTSNSATIYGEVCGNNQTDASGIDTSGTNGLYEVGVDTTECGTDDPLPSLPLPDHDRDQQKADITTTSSSSYYTNCNSNSANRTWPHGLRINGNVVIRKKCKVTIEGDVWITGNLTVSNSAQLIISDTLDAGIVDGTYPSVMVDGSNGISFGNSSKVVDNSSDIGAQLITYWSEAGCSPDCGNVTGQDLFDSTPETTIYLQQSSEAPGSILYAKWSQVELNNGGDIGALVGQRVRLRNSAAVTFGASVTGGGGGGGSMSMPTWLVENYRKN